MKARKILTLGFLASLIWGTAFLAVLVIVDPFDKIGPAIGGFTCLLLAVSVYVKLRQGQFFELLPGYLISSVFVGLSVFLLWLTNILDNFNFSSLVFVFGSGGFLSINLLIVGYALCLQLLEMHA